MPNLLAASDPERASHRAFGLPNLEFTQNETNWPYKVSMAAVKDMLVDIPGELPGPMDPIAAGEILDKKDHYELTEADEQMMATGHGQLVGQFLLDRQGIVRWSFTEVPEGGRYMFGGPSPQELMSAVSQVAQ
jgi:hypothetical protein